MSKVFYKVVDLFGNETIMASERKLKTKKNLFTDYDGFESKFEPKKTTDDCYTPKPVFDAVLDYVKGKIDLTGLEIIRPFLLDGDFESLDYPENCIIIDNPPFSILSKIVKFFNSKNIKYFLFAPHLTIFVIKDCTHVITCCDIIYENGANVKTSFVSNVFNDLEVVTAPELYKSIKKINNNNRVNLPKYQYPLNVLTVSALSKIVENDIVLEIKKDDCYYIRGLDDQKRHGKALFGSGYLLSDKAAADKAAADKAAAEGDNVIIWRLSEKEKQIINNLKNIE